MLEQSEVFYFSIKFNFLLFWDTESEKSFVRFLEFGTFVERYLKDAFNDKKEKV